MVGPVIFYLVTLFEAAFEDSSEATDDGKVLVAIYKLVDTEWVYRKLMRELT